MLRKLYSQAGQDHWVIRDVLNFKRNGFFLDIGAADGVTYSNSYALEKYFGWKGVCIEGDAKTYQVLKGNRTATCVNACIDSTSREAVFTTEKGLYGGIVESDTDNKALVEGKERGVVVTTQKLEDVLRQHQAPAVIDYLSLDIEGAEERALRDFPFDQWTFLCATIERPTLVLKEVLARNNYHLVAEQPELDAFYIHETISGKYLRRFLERAERQNLSASQKMVAALQGVMKRGLRASLDRI
jgi:FkbM family methyltransferase